MMIRLLVLTALIQLTVNLPVPDAKVYFPDDNIPIDPRSGYSQHPSQGGQQHTYYTKTSTHRKGGGYQSPIQWPSADDGIGHQYGTSGHHTSYSSYGQHPHHLSYSSHSYGAGGSADGSYTSGQSPVVQTHESHSYHGGSHPTGGSVEGQIEQVSHGGSYHRTESQNGPEYEIHNWQETGNQASQHGQPDRVVEETHVQQSSYGGHHAEGQIEQTSNTGHVDESRGAGTSYGQHTAEDAHVVEETKHEEVQKPSAADIAAEEHHIIKEIEELAGITSSPEGNTKNPITQQQEIIRELKGLRDPNSKRNQGKGDSPAVEAIPPIVHHDDHAPEESQAHQREVVETPAVKVASDQGSLGVHHENVGSSHHQVHTETREETSHHSGSHKKSTPDPLDLMNIYNDYVSGDFKPGHYKEPVPEPQKELKPEIKQAIDNIMRDWEVLPDREGKPIPPPRNFKVTKHVKVTTTTHNNPIVVPPSRTITKTVKTHTFHPSTANHQLITHHINIAELLEQLRQLESSPHHRNVTWCEEKIKEFLTELNRKEESGIEINQSVQEETLHHILTNDQTITQEIHHVVGHDASEGVKEEPFVKKTIAELGLNEPTKPPSYWTEQETKHETHVNTGENSGQEEQKEVVAVEEHKESEPKEIEYGHGESSAEPPREPDESHIITITPSPHHIPPLESLSHQTHTSTETKESIPIENSEEKNEVEHQNTGKGNMEPHGSEPEGVTAAPAQPTPERPDHSDVEEFQGENEKHDRPLPPNYKPRDRSEEETNESENHELHQGNEVEEGEHKRIEDLSIELPENEFTHEKGEEHKSIEDLNIDLPEYEENPSLKDEVKTSIEQEQETGQEAKNPNGHLGTEEVEIDHHNGEGKQEGSYGHHEEEHVVHEVKTGEHSGGANTEYVVETEHHSSGGRHEQSGGGAQTEYTEETVEHNSGGSHGKSGGVNTEYVEETVEHHNSGGGHGHSGGINTEYVEETVEHHNTGGSHGHSGGINTEYVEETVEHHSSGGSRGHKGGGSQTVIEETVEHHNSGENQEVNYDQLIEELISLESLPGHEAIDKCEDKIRQFLEVLKRQQERGFDQNKVELERLRHLIEEMQAQKQNQINNGVNPHNPEASTSFWKKIGKKIKSTFEKAKTKAHDTVNGMMN